MEKQKKEKSEYQKTFEKYLKEFINKNKRAIYSHYSIRIK